MRQVAVSLADLDLAVDFVASGEAVGAEAYVNRVTGQVHFLSLDTLDLEPRPADLDESDHYVAVPHKRELDLGFRLVNDFAQERMRYAVDEINDIFRRRGAYRRFRALLDRHGMLDAWHSYENAAREKALREWCAEVGIALKD